MHAAAEFGERSIWVRAKDLFDSALEHEPRKRQAYLEQACGADYELRELLQMLLSRYEQASSLVPSFSGAEQLAAAEPSPVLLPGTRLLDRFEITRLAGTGGMGQVYEARDLSLDLPVAIKILRQHLLVAPQVRQRFRAEVRRSREITHRNVCRVHELFEGGATDPDLLFLTMEFLHGETLAERLRRDPAWVSANAPAILSQICDALEAVHAEKVVHLDLKPSNVFLTCPSGSDTLRTVVTDFGLAALLDLEGSRLRAFALGGTPGYMAPEQLFSGDVGPAADLYALAIIASEIVSDKPEHWNGAVQKSLQVDPEKRHASVREFWEDLSGVSARKVRLSRRRLALAGFAGISVSAAGLYWKSILDAPALKLAVLPFETDTGPADDHIAIGLTESTIQLLRSDPKIFSPGLTSVLRFRGRSLPSSELCRQLGVDALLSVSLQQRDSHWILSARSVFADGSAGPLTVILEFPPGRLPQAPLEIANRARQAFLPLAKFDAVAVQSTTASPAANDAYLRGRYLWNRRSPGDVDLAVQHFQKALESDPNFALAHCGVADGLSSLADSGAADPRQVSARAKTASADALRLAPRLPHAHASAGLVATLFSYDLATGLSELHTACRLDPGNASAHQWLSALYLKLGDWRRCHEEIDLAFGADSLNLAAEFAAAAMRYFTRHYRLAIDRFNAIARTNPTFWVIHEMLGESYARLGQKELALQHSALALKQSKHRPHSAVYAAATAAIAGDKARAEEFATEAERQFRSARYFQPVHLARVYAELRDPSRAFGFLEDALEMRDTGFPVITVHHSFDSLRDDPRYMTLLKKAAIRRP